MIGFPMRQQRYRCSAKCANTHYCIVLPVPCNRQSLFYLWRLYQTHSPEPLLATTFLLARHLPISDGMKLAPMSDRPVMGSVEKCRCASHSSLSAWARSSLSIAHSRRSFIQVVSLVASTVAAQVAGL